MAAASVRWCQAHPELPHPATRRNGYCELHNVEYQRARNQAKTATYNYVHGRTSQPPGTTEDYLTRAGGFTPLRATHITLTDDIVTALATHGWDLAQATRLYTTIEVVADGFRKLDERGAFAYVGAPELLPLLAQLATLPALAASARTATLVLTTLITTRLGDENPKWPNPHQPNRPGISVTAG